MVPKPGQLVERLGGHSTSALEIDLAEERGLGSWLILACLRAGRVDEAVAELAWAALRDAGLGGAVDLAGADPVRVATVLAGARYPKPEVAAPRLSRIFRSLAERWEGSVTALASDALDFAELGTRLTRLAPGLGAATAIDFLRPLRDRIAAAGETPLAPTARIAAEHLGWLRPGEDEDGEPGALRAFLADDAEAPALADVEAALDRLGRRACRRERVDRCPLGEECPQRAAAVAAPSRQE